MSALFSFLGIGIILFLPTYRWEIVGASILLIFVALYFVSKRIAGKCVDCQAPESKAKERATRQCMQCGSKEVKWHAGGITGEIYDCQSCGFIGPPVIEGKGKNK